MGTSPIVEVAFGSAPVAASPVWTDITRYVHTGSPIEIRRGRPDEFDSIQPGTCALTVDNSDGRFTPRNPASPYYPNVRKGRRIRIRQVHVETNHLLNPSFETGSTLNWSWSGGAAVAAVTTRAHHGGFSGQITWAAGTDGVVSANLYGLEAGHTYAVSAWVWVPAGAPSVRLGIQGGALGAANTAVDAWEQITHTFTATNTRHMLTLTPAAAAAAGQQCWLDEVMVGAPGAPFSPTPAVISPRFNGYINRWPTEWPGGGRVATAQLTATDVFKRLDREPVRSMLEEEVLADRPFAYYPLAEPTGATSAGDLSGAGRAPLELTQVGGGGDFSFGTATGAPADGLSAPTFTPSTQRDGVYLVGDLGPQFEQATSSMFIAVECWFSCAVPPAGQRRFILAVGSVDFSFQLAFRVNEAGRLELFWTWREPGSAAQRADFAVLSNTVYADGQPHHIVYDEALQRVYVDGVLLASPPSAAMYRLRTLQVGGFFTDGFITGSVSHVAVYANGSMPSARIVDHYKAGATGFAGEAANLRLQRIAGYAGITTLAIQGGLFDPIAGQGPGDKTPLALMREVVVTESGHLVAGRDDGLVYQARDVRYNKTALLTLDAADLEPPRYADDDQYLINRIEASRPGGASIRIEDTASQADYGVYARTLNLLKTSDAAMVDAARWLVGRYADPPPRLQELPVEGSTLGTATYRALLDLEISDLVTITGLPSQAPAATETVVIEGWVERIGPGQHWWTFHGSRGETDQVWQLNSPVFSVLGSSTRLAY